MRRNRSAISPAAPRRITDTFQLDELATLQGTLAGYTVDLRLPGMDAPELQTWQNAINRDRAACGCREGAVFLLVCEALYASGVLLHFFMRGTSTRSQLGVGLAIAFGAAPMGKLFGLLRARLRLRRTIRELAAAIKDGENGARTFSRA